MRNLLFLAAVLVCGLTGMIVAAFAPCSWQLAPPTVGPVEGLYNPKTAAMLVHHTALGTIETWTTLSDETGQHFPAIPYAGAFLSVAFAPDGKAVLTGSDKGALALWDAQSGLLLHSLQGRSISPVRAVAYAPDGSTVLAGSDDGTSRLWDARSGALLYSLERLPKVHGVVLVVAYAPDSKTVLVSNSFTLDQDGTASFWDARSGAYLGDLQTRANYMWSVAFSPDNKMMLTGYDEEPARLWYPSTPRIGGKISTLQGHTGRVWSVAFSPDGNTALTGGEDRTARLWDTHSGALLHTLIGHGAGVTHVAFAPDGKTVLTGGSLDETAMLWDAQSGELLHVLRGHNAPVMSVAYAPDGKTVLTGSGDGTVILWDVEFGNMLRPLRPLALGSQWAYVGTGLCLASGIAALGFFRRLWQLAPTASMMAMTERRNEVGLAERKANAKR